MQKRARIPYRTFIKFRLEYARSMDMRDRRAGPFFWFPHRPQPQVRPCRCNGADMLPFPHGSFFNGNTVAFHLRKPATSVLHTRLFLGGEKKGAVGRGG